jgi:hypothetical protein
MSTGGSITDDDRRAYYRASVEALAFLEKRKPSGRRFGPDADALWSALRGDQTTADRIDLLVRDADAHWPGSFGARTVFERFGVAEDESFGLGWLSLRPTEAEDLYRQIAGTEGAADVGSLYRRVLSAWGLSLAPFDSGPIAPTDRLLVAGPSAVAALVAKFSEGKGLDWADQVVVVATPPAHRQAAGLALSVLDVMKRVEILSVATAAHLLDKGQASRRRVVVSPDADPRDAEVARAGAHPSSREAS